MKRLLHCILFFVPFVYISNAQQVVWVRQAGGIDEDGGSAITMDNNNNVYITGWFEDTATFDKTDTSNLVLITGTSNFFIAKYDSLGNLLWINQSECSGSSGGSSVVTDNDNNVYAIGSFAGGIITFNDTTLTPNGGSTSFVVKYNSAGKLLWARKDNSMNYSIATDNTDNVYITGVFGGTTIFGDTTLNSIPTGELNVFIAKYDSAGNFVWVRQAGGGNINYEWARSIDIDNKNNIYIASNFENTISFSSTVLNGHSDAFIAKYDNAGNFIWAKKTGGSGLEIANSIAADNNNNVYITGEFEGTAFFDNVNLTSYGFWDIYIAKYDDAGNFVWAKKAGSNGGDAGFSIDVIDNKVYVTGVFEGTATFENTNLTSQGDDDIFIARYDSAGNFVWVKNCGGKVYDYGISIVIGENDNVFITGGFEGTVTFDNVNLTSYGDDDIFIAKIKDTTIFNIGVKEIVCNNSIKFYPNPSNGIFNISITGITDAVELLITNLQGQVVYSKQFNNTTFKQIDLSEQPKGMYFVKVQSNDIIKVEKLIIN